jgi:hypothetical protein
MTQDQQSQHSHYYSEEYRHECEVRWIASLHLQKRREFLANVQEKRGLDARLRLQEGLTQLWKTKNTTQMTL